MDAKDQPAGGRSGAWWQPWQVPQNHTLHGRLGPLALQVHHVQGEWRIASTTSVEQREPTCAEITVRPGCGDAEQWERILLARADSQLALKPLLADRPVVIRPRQAIVLPGGEETVMYMSTPISVRLEVGQPPVVLREVSSVRLSDTWFGPSTREGELCYAGKTGALHTLAEVPQRVHRALTPVHIRNKGNSPLPLDKVSLPVPVLSLYGTPDGYLWTEGVTLVRSGESDMAALKVDSGPPAYAGQVTLISDPRAPQARGGLVRAFSLLFGE
ncbi:MAG: hypothetical protein PHQ53_05840 [Candidatus Krumholzibacteria bacterium]|nr:hypothetical protein [Candidatus Krumholzibacteria bacterium]